MTLSTGRIAVKRGANSVTLSLAQWAHKSDATLSVAEAKILIRTLEEAIAATQGEVVEGIP